MNLAKYERILVKLDRVSAQPQLTQCGAMLNNLCVFRFLWWLHKFLISPLVVVFVILFFAIFWRNIYHPTSTYIELNELISVLFWLTNREREKNWKCKHFERHFIHNGIRDLSKIEKLVSELHHKWSTRYVFFSAKFVGLKSGVEMWTWVLRKSNLYLCWNSENWNAFLSLQMRTKKNTVGRNIWICIANSWNNVILFSFVANGTY